jgi:protein SCO1/2
MRRLALLIVLALAACARGNPAADFTLRGDGSQPWALSGQRGKTVVLTFGYTHCTDTCPLTLGKLAKVLRELGARGGDVTVAFVTVDPQRDTPSVLSAYLQPFGRGFVGLTGTPQQLAAVEHAYHVWAQRIPGKRGNDDYDDSHSGAIFFIDPRGNVTSVHDSSDSIEDLTKAMDAALG